MTMWAATWMFEMLAVFWEVVTQKLTMRGVPELEDVGGPAAGLTVVITGPTGGIGQQTATELARRGAHVVLACRNIQKGQAFKKELETAAKHEGREAPKLEVMELDVSSLDSVRRFAQSWLARGKPLHVLVNNAGIFSMSAPYTVTKEGLEAHVVTNHVGHFLLTLLLLPSLRQGTLERGSASRVVHVSSKLHYMGRVRKDDPNLRRWYTSLSAYCQSKLMQVQFSNELQARVGGSVRSVAVHPGEVLTNVISTLPGLLRWLYAKTLHGILLTPPQGARSSVYAATSPHLPPHAAYLHSDCTAQEPSAEARDTDLARWVWTWSAEAAALAPDQDLPQA